MCCLCGKPENEFSAEITSPFKRTFCLSRDFNLSLSKDQDDEGVEKTQILEKSVCGKAGKEFVVF